MKFARVILNTILSNSLSINNEKGKKIDMVMLKFFGYLSELLGYCRSDVLGHPGMLHILYVLVKSIIKTPYGHPLHFVNPLLITVSVINNCPFKCRFCYSHSNSQSYKKYISLNAIKKILDSNIPCIILTGGEPILSPNLYEILDYASLKGKYIFITTHANLSDIIPFINKYSDLLIYTLSIYGNKTIHNYYRGDGSYQNLLNTAKFISNSKARLIINYVLVDNNFSSLFLLIELAKNIKLHEVYITRLICSGGMLNSLHDDFNKERKEKLFDICKKIKEQINVNITISIPGIEMTFNKNVYFISFLQRMFGIPKRESFCSAGNWAMHVDTNGNIHPCFSQESNKSFGNINEKDIDEVWKELCSKYEKVNYCISELINERNSYERLNACN